MVGVDVVEVSPPYDHADITAALANRVVLEALSAIARRRQDARDGTTLGPGPAAARRPLTGALSVRSASRGRRGRRPRSTQPASGSTSRARSCVEASTTGGAAPSS